MLVAAALLAVAVAAVFLWWGAWAVMAVAAVVAIVEYAALVRTERFSARLGRIAPSRRGCRRLGRLPSCWHRYCCRACICR